MNNIILQLFMLPVVLAVAVYVIACTASLAIILRTGIWSMESISRFADSSSVSSAGGMDAPAVLVSAPPAHALRAYVIACAAALMCLSISEDVSAEYVMGSVDPGLYGGCYLTYTDAYVTLECTPGSLNSCAPDGREEWEPARFTCEVPIYMRDLTPFIGGRMKLMAVARQIAASVVFGGAMQKHPDMSANANIITDSSKTKRPQHLKGL